jgi:hypothetical protein
MRNKVLLSGLIFTAFIACNKKVETPEIPMPAPPPEPARQKECYEFVKGKDTISLSLAMNSNNANGELTYNLFEKDKNSGTFSGVFIGDTLYADYTFKSEGMNSVRETVFVKKGNQLIQGTGEMEEKDNKQFFKNAKKLKFDGGIVLVKSDCK